MAMSHGTPDDLETAQVNRSEFQRRRRRYWLFKKHPAGFMGGREFKEGAERIDSALSTRSAAKLRDGK